MVDETDTDPFDASVCADGDADGCDDCSVGPVDPLNDGDDFDADGQCDLTDPDDDGRYAFTLTCPGIEEMSSNRSVGNSCFAYQ